MTTKQTHLYRSIRTEIHGSSWWPAVLMYRDSTLRKLFEFFLNRIRHRSKIDPVTCVDLHANEIKLSEITLVSKY